MLNVGKSEAEREEELKNKAMCCSYKDTTPFLIINPLDNSEFWDYLYKYNGEEEKTYGMLTFVENLYQNYSIRELDHPNLIEVTSKIRETLLNLANKIFKFVDTHESVIKENT